MSAYYELYESPCSDSDREEGKQRNPHARIVRSVTYDTPALITEISGRCTLTAADIKAVLQAMSESVRSHLTDGDRVSLEGLGSFYVSLQCMPEEGKRITARHIGFGRVHFLPEAAMKEELKGMTVTLNPTPLPASRRTETERRGILTRLLTEKELIMLRDYRVAAALTEYRAKADLLSWIAEGWLGRKGNRSCYWYYLKS